MQNMELAIRERAYYLWQEAGSPEGNSDAFWLSAQRELLASSLAAKFTVADAAAPGSKKPRTKTAAKPAKGKRRAA
jgi:hypothetical protein